MKIFLEIFNDNVVGWGTNLENAPSIEIEDNHDFFKNPSAYEYVNNELVLKEITE